MSNEKEGSHVVAAPTPPAEFTVSDEELEASLAEAAASRKADGSPDPNYIDTLTAMFQLFAELLDSLGDIAFGYAITFYTWLASVSVGDLVAVIAAGRGTHVLVRITDLSAGLRAMIVKNPSFPARYASSAMAVKSPRILAVLIVIEAILAIIGFFQIVDLLSDGDPVKAWERVKNNIDPATPPDSPALCVLALAVVASTPASKRKDLPADVITSWQACRPKLSDWPIEGVLDAFASIRAQADE